MLQQKLLIQVLSVLDDNHIEYMVTGSVVSSLQGEPRTTHDIDIVIHMAPKYISVLLRAFPFPQYYLSETGIRDAIQHKSMFNLLNTTDGDKIDFWILTEEIFDISRFKRRYEEDVFGLKMKISSPEDTILAKLRWAKLSGGSEKQLTDAIRVYEIQFVDLDLKYIESWIKQLQLEELWDKLKDQAMPIK